MPWPAARGSAGGRSHMAAARSPASFVHLHVHTEYSMLDGAAKVSPLLQETARLEMPAGGMTDHGNMFGSDAFCRQARKAGVQPGIGSTARPAPEVGVADAPGS